MASSTQKPQVLPHAEMATPPDSPNREFQNTKKRSQLIDNKIENILSDMRNPGSNPQSPSIKDRLEHLLKTIRDGEASDTAADTLKLKNAETGTVPHNASSEPVTVDQLIWLMEAAFKSKEPLDSAVYGHTSGDQEMPNGRYWSPPCVYHH
jgi:hypothetical protein